MEAQERLSQALIGTYRIEGEIGSGGMATVYRAQDLKHDRQVALKVLRPELSAGLGADRFVREIEIAAKLAHPHILPLFDSGQAGGFLYYVMPYVEGESLEDRLAREGKLGAEEAIRLTDQIASALTYAHEQGVVHRDIKPANILLAGDQAIVADFGIARAVEAASGEGLTGTGLAVGTPAYMSPEQAMGGGGVDARTDIYALGCVVYEMVTGGVPLEGRDPKALAAKRKVGKGPSLRMTDPSLPVFLDRAVSKALATDPGERFDTAAAFAEALTTGTVVPAVRPRRGWRRWVVTGAAAAVVVALAGWWLVQGPGGPRMERLAVLPLTNLTGDPEQDYLAGGVHEALISELGQLGLHTISRASTVGYSGTEKGIGEIARELGVEGVIQASVFREGDSLEIAARLLDREEREVWAGSFDGVLPNIVALYRGFARAIAGQVRLSLSPDRRSRLEEAAPVNPAVYEAYLRGMHILTSQKALASAAEAIQYFRQAVEQNPTDALAWAGLAGCFVTLGHNSMISDPVLWSDAESAARRAIRLDSLSAEGWAALADYQAYWGRDWEEAERAFQRANELNPSLAWNHYHYAWYLALFGKVEEAVAEHRRAIELDPLTHFHTTWLPGLYLYSGEYERAYAEARKVVENGYSENFTALNVLGRSAELAGLYEEAIAAMEKAAAINPGARGNLGTIYARAGRTEDAMQIVRELESQLPSPGTARMLASIYATLGNRDEALRWLAFDPPHFQLPWGLRRAEFADYRDDPRFQAIARSVNLRFDPGALAPTPLPAKKNEGSGTLPSP